MKPTRLLTGAALLAASLVLGSCGTEEPAASLAGPEVTPNASLLGNLLKPLGLLSCSPLPYASDTETIGPAGGVLHIGPHTFLVPPGALSDPVTITGEAPTGTVNAVRFSPAGLQFEQPAYLTMSYANCDIVSKLLPKRIAYTDNLLRILEYLVSWDNVWAERVTGQVEHFSSYAVAW